jgi:hypothetical protein
MFLRFFFALAGLSAAFKNHTIINGGACEIEDDNLERWQPDDRVEVYLAEYTLQHVSLSAWLGFSTAHMAVVFQNPRIRKWYVMDSFARSAETIANIIMPSISPDSPYNQMSLWARIVSYLRGDLVRYLTWDNLGYVRLREDKTDDEFRDMQHIGATTASEVKRIRSWVTDVYTGQGAVTPFTFDMWQIYNATTSERIRRSRMCHDFVEEVLGMIQFKDQDEIPTIDIFRDSLNLNVTTWQIVDIENAKITRDYQRFLRFFRNHVYESTRDLKHSVITITKFIALGLPFMLFLDGNTYVKVGLAEYGVLNYCRMPMHFDKGEPYIPAKLDDESQQCFLPSYVMSEVLGRVRFTLADYAIWFEQHIDDAIFGVDGNVGVWTNIGQIVGTTMILLGITRLIKWLTSRKTNQ